MILQKYVKHTHFISWLELISVMLILIDGVDGKASQTLYG